jgi:hypothetical protein
LSECSFCFVWGGTVRAWIIEWVDVVDVRIIGKVKEFPRYTERGHDDQGKGKNGGEASNIVTSFPQISKSSMRKLLS